ncbi:MAG: hypothetical protein CL678_01445 [Bdellovibrionaceae bacterium]|nr:hypothetical protein [Pseudobdellovibrionaceae bacterium]|tara:strand:- start:1529 stop:2803 length:1275 start_codon:yes stop_codon:yes gene_type:complete
MAIPHTTGGEATGEAFFEGRRSYVQALENTVNNTGDNLILILGPRRIGKTSIVKQYFEERNAAEDDPGVYVYIYLPKIANLVDFYKKSIEEIQESLKRNGKFKKFQDVARLSRVKRAFATFRNSIDEIKAAGYGIKVKDSDKWEEYTSLVASLREEFISLILTFEKEKVVLGFDEVPEAIQHLLKNENGRDEVELWLEHFREMRHNTQLKDIVTLILFGSVNMKLTLERINQSKGVNDAYNITVEPLEIADVKKLFWDLVDTLDYKILESNKEIVEPFLEKMFNYVSPWAIQNFLDQLEPPKEKNQIETELKSAYYRLFDVVGGVRYLEERLNEYYVEGEIIQLKAILKYLVEQHIDHGEEEIQDKELLDWSKKELLIDIEGYRHLIDILLLDNMIYRSGNGYAIRNTVERYYWYVRLVGPCDL